MTIVDSQGVDTIFDEALVERLVAAKKIRASAAPKP
jgi:hypothetical protein